MPFVPHFRARRIWKAKRAASLKGRPEWQDQVPDSKQGRDAYAIAAKYENTFTKAFLEAVRTLITPEVEKEFRKAWRSGSITQMMNAIPILDEQPQDATWEKFLDKLSAAYATVIQAAGDAATRDMNRTLGTKMRFTTLPPEEPVEEITKAHSRSKCMECSAEPELVVIWADGRARAWFCKGCYESWKEEGDREVVRVTPVVGGVVQKSMDDVRRAAQGLTVGVNPYSVEWIKDRGLELATEGISKQQKQVVTDIIQREMEVGGRATNAIENIKANIGLTNREYGATLKRRQLHLDAGLSEDKADELTGKYREKLLRSRAQRIARTETIAAQAQGRLASWKVAQDAGELPAVQRRWLAPPPSPSPNRPCIFCLDADGATAPLGEPYDLPLSGFVEGPPLHPS